MDDNVSIKAFVQAMDAAGLADNPTRDWLAGYAGPGDDGRRTPGEDRLSIAYDHDHMLDDLGVICRFAGIDTWRIADALEAARRASDNPAVQSKVFRQLIPWGDVLSGAKAFTTSSPRP